jgi:hypothetical protein
VLTPTEHSRVAEHPWPRHSDNKFACPHIEIAQLPKNTAWPKVIGRSAHPLVDADLHFRRLIH